MLLELFVHMVERHSLREPSPFPDPGLRGPGTPGPGVTTYDLGGDPRATDAARDLTHRWCTDRAVPVRAADRIVLLAQAATRHGIGLDPRAVALGLRWLDADRVGVDVRSCDCTHLPGSASPDTRGAGPTADVFDTTSESWGLRVRAPDAIHWFVVDTRN